uniref:Condensation domain protein n=1 Tax=Sorangium cellulosum TaxID=56 RepID=A0A3S7UZL6_SORCE|nr:condensation domain protein [Sorangium cellulosum]
MDEARRDRLEQALRNLSPAKRALFERELERRRRGEAAPERIPRAPRTGPLPLSIAQEWMWRQHERDPTKCARNLSAPLRLVGQLRPDVLEAALRLLVDRHEALRTTFVLKDGVPAQVVHGHLDFEFVQAELPPSERSIEAIKAAARRFIERPFDLERGPVFRVTLLACGEREHVLLLVMHHIVTDGWSMGILARECSVLYQAVAEGRPSPLPALPVHQGDYAVWQRERERRGGFERGLAYWRDHLSGAPPAIELPTDRPRPASPSFRGAKVPVALSGALTRSLKGLCAEQGTTLFTGLLAAFEVLLATYSGQRDFVVTTVTANRGNPDIEAVVGLFLNYLPLRARVQGTFRSLLADVRDVTLGAFAHQDLPFKKVLDVVCPAYDDSRTPFFEISILLHNTPPARLSFSGVDVEAISLDPGTTRRDMTLEWTERDGALSGFLQYSTDLFDHGTVERMVRDLHTIVEVAVEQPDTETAELSRMLRGAAAR